MAQPTVAEILKASGLTDEEIGKLDAKVAAGFTQVLTAAEQEREKAELAQRSTREIFDKEINPALDNWAMSEANLTAERDYYKTLAEKAKTGGLIPDAAPFKVEATPGSPIRNADGTFRPSGTPAPAEEVKKLRDDMGGAFAFLADTSWKYRTLFGSELPDAPTVIIREAAAQRMSPGDYAAKKYNFSGKEQEKREAAQKAHDDAIRKEVAEQKDKEWSEKTANGSPVRQAEVSQFSEVRQAVKEGKRPDPLKMNPQERAAATRQSIRRDIAAQESGTVQ
jgi:hypothetical protein